MPKAELAEVTLHYEEAGDGPLAYVHCHGLGGSNESFEREDMGWYAERFRTISWDQRGLGRSGPATKYSLPRYAEDLNGLLDYLGIEKAVVMGVSWGGVLVQRFALDYPERCAAIVLDSTSSEVNPRSAENWYLRGEVARLGQTALEGREIAPAFEGHVTMAEQRDVESRVAPEHLESYVAQARATAGLREHSMTPYLNRIECPALVVGGGQDKVAGAGGSVVIARAIGENARLEILQEAGHGVYRQGRDEFRKLLLEFLADNHLT
jgi:pimeloyl-ACP methyl ester carboxylesterase